MARYDERPVPRGASRRWEVLISDPERAPRVAARRFASEVQADHRVLRELSADLLRAVPLVAEGALERRREYVDLHDPARADFRAEGGEPVKPGQRLVARDEVSAEAWEELRAACDRVVRHRPLRRAG